MPTAHEAQSRDNPKPGVDRVVVGRAGGDCMLHRFREPDPTIRPEYFPSRREAIRRGKRLAGEERGVRLFVQEEFDDGQRRWVRVHIR